LRPLILTHTAGEDRRNKRAIAQKYKYRRLILTHAAAEDRRNKRAIAACPGALQILVQLVAASAPDTQSNAACAIANLVADEDDTKSAFAEVPRMRP
jgi:hypothetical protein